MRTRERLEKDCWWMDAGGNTRKHERHNRKIHPPTVQLYCTIPVPVQHPKQGMMCACVISTRSEKNVRKNLQYLFVQSTQTPRPFYTQKIC